MTGKPQINKISLIRGINLLIDAALKPGRTGLTAVNKVTQRPVIVAENHMRKVSGGKYPVVMDTADIAAGGAFVNQHL